MRVNMTQVGQYKAKFNKGSQMYDVFKETPKEFGGTNRQHISSFKKQKTAQRVVRELEEGTYA